MKSVKTIAINVGILAGLLILLNGLALLINMLSAGGKQSGYPYRGLRRSELLNNGKDSAYNRLVMTEFYQLETEYKPYLVWSRKPFEGRTTNINTEGDRETKCASCQVHDSSLVTRFFGGSTMWGTGVDDNGTIPAFYNQINPTEVTYNHGESGFVSRQNLARLVNLINQDASIDKVVFYEGFNDILTLCRKEVDYNSHDRAIQINGFIETAKHSRSAVQITKSFLHLIFLRYTAQLIAKRQNQDASGFKDEHYKCCTDPTSIQKVVRTMVENWSLAQSMCKARNIDFHAFLQPAAYVGQPLFDSRYQNIREDCIPDIYADICRQVVEELETQSWFHDLTSVLDGQGPFYIDGCHISDPGNKLVAEAIDQIINNRLSPSTPPSVEK